MFRSEEMCLAQVFLQTEVAFGSIRDLGELGLVQFQDLNPETNAFNRKFVNEVRRCEEMERRIRYVQKEVLRAGLDLSQVERNSECPMPRDMIDIEASLETMESELREVESNYEVLQKSRLELCELYQVLVKANSFLKEKPDPDTLGDSAFHGGPVEMHTALKLGFKAGVINRERLPAFERILWRACRGFVLLRFTAADDCLQDPVTGEKVSKDVFVIFFQGEKLKNLANKICEGFRATMYPCPDSTAERSKILSNVTTRLEDLRSILEETQQHRMRVLTLARENLPTWIIRVHMMKAVYHVLNKCNVDVTQKCIIAEIWCPLADLDVVRHSLHKSTEKAGSTVPSILNCMSTTKEPPTFNRTNKFTKGFQVIVDAYGVGCYREVNPALYTIITFPFLFAVMFGDIGHGIIMALFALTLVFNEKKLEANKGANEIFDTFIGGRYIILLMGLFSIYTGLIYNDCFSKSFNIFGSTWNVNAMFINGSWPNKTFMENNVLQLDPVVKDVFNGPYPFGIDPIWNLSPNKLTFLNSFKMKMSVILGVIHMTIGICLSLVNHIYFNNKMNIFLEFVPEIIFILALFGYLVALIIFKWIVCKSADSKNSQSLLIAFINMFMFDNSGAKLYSGQGDVQYFLVVFALICVPWMLLVKPIILCVNHNKKERKSMVFQYSKDQDAILTDPDYATLSSSSMDMNDTPEEAFDAGDVFVHQAIHTIEYCLGCISNTASYLRLWALSLAHAQLSEVLWNLLLNIAFTSTTSYAGIVPVVIIFFCFAVLTIAILLVMEGLSAFLHALRLHWVEFQNKFYTGSGYLFTPFTFKISEDEDRN